MKKYLLLLFLFLSTTVLIAQTDRMENAASGKTYSSMKDRSNTQPFLNIAQNQLRAMDVDAAFLTIENALAQNPRSAELLMLRARCNILYGFVKEAEKDIQKAKKINPYIAKIYGNFIRGGLENILYSNPEEAVLEISTYKKMGYYYPLLDELILDKNNTTNSLEQFELALTEIESANYDKAILLIDQSLEKEAPTFYWYDLKSIALKESDQLIEAEKYALKALDSKADFAIGLFNYADILNRKGDYDESLEYIDQSLKLNPSLTKAYFLRALVNKKKGRIKEAIKDYDKIISIHGEDYYEAYVNRGLAHKINGDMGAALSDLKFVIDAFPNNARLRNNLGNLYLLLGLPTKAMDEYTTALTIDNTFAEVYFNRSLAHFQLFDKISGCFDLERSKELGYSPAAEVINYSCTHE